MQVCLIFAGECEENRRTGACCLTTLSAQLQARLVALMKGADQSSSERERDSSDVSRESDARSIRRRGKGRREEAKTKARE